MRGWGWYAAASSVSRQMASSCPTWAGTRLNPHWQVLPALIQLGAKVQFGGGGASLADVQATAQANLHGLIIGRALYEGQVDLREALDWRGTHRNSGEL